MTIRVGVSEEVPPGAVESVVQAVQGDPERWLPTPSQALGDGWLFYLWVGEVGHLVQATVGTATNVGGRISRPLRWRGSTVRTASRGWVPTFDGELFVTPEADGGATLHLVGTYSPPLGVIGAALDRLYVGRLARGSIRQLLRDIMAKASEQPVPRDRAAPMMPAFSPSRHWS